MVKKPSPDRAEMGADTPRPVNRRTLLASIWWWLGLGALLQVAAVVAGFLYSGTRPRPQADDHLIDAGPVDSFAPGSVTLIRAAHCYVVCLEDGGLLALSRTCTHLGCAVPWIEEAGQFQCPCHASVFDRTGNVLRAPAPRALDLHPLRLEGGRLLIDAHRRVRRAGFDTGQLFFPDAAT